MVNNKNKNSSNSLVFGRWPQTKTNKSFCSAITQTVLKLIVFYCFVDLALRWLGIFRIYIDTLDPAILSCLDPHFPYILMLKERK